MGTFRTLLLVLTAFVLWLPDTQAQQQQWDSEDSYLTREQGDIVRVTLPAMTKQTLVSIAQLNPGSGQPALQFGNFTLSPDGKKLLLFTDSRREYHNSFYSCWVYDLATKKLARAGAQLPKGQLLNAQFSPDSRYLAFVYNNNIYVEDLTAFTTKQLTTDGSETKLNGWFDYVYSEELFLTNGLRWSPDSKRIAFWQMDASKLGTFYMINNTDSIYPRPVPIAFTKPGQPIAEAKIGVVTIADAKKTWVTLEGQPQQYYITQMDWNPDNRNLVIQQLNRRQSESKLILCNPATNTKNTLFTDTDEAWVDVKSFWNRGGSPFDWIANGAAFIWFSEKSGWRKLYRIGIDGKQTEITKGDHDVMAISGIDEKNGYVYYSASPTSAVQRYLYRAKLDGSGTPEKVSPASQEGTHRYTFSPSGKWAQHSFSSYKILPASEWLQMPANTPLDPATAIEKNMKPNPQASRVTFFTIKTDEGVEMDGYMVKPLDFDEKKKFPVVFTTYSEPAGATVNDAAGVGGRGAFYNADSGYITMAVEGRGTPIPKGRAWRKAIYGKLGWINPNDQAAAAKKILEWPFIDRERIAVYGSSGGGSTTLHLLFRYPEIYKVGLASAGVPSHLLYNSTYQERYLGLLPESRENYIKGSAITYAKNLQGNLLIMHGTGDHNVHYQGEELLLNELIKYNRQFQFMPYPNRQHGISEGEGTQQHRRTMMANFLKTYCPPGGR
jgi:dipeptidyl-peptidase-4